MEFYLLDGKRLRIRYMMFAARVVQSNDCVLCEAEMETEEHLWFECVFVRDVAHQVLEWARIRHRETTIDGWLEWFARDPRPGSF